MFATLLCLFASAQAETTGVLGLRYADGSVSTWAVDEGGLLTRLGSGLAVPTDSGWMVIDLMTMSRAPGSSESVLRYGTPGHLPDLAGVTSGDDIDEVARDVGGAEFSERITILSASPTLLTYEVTGRAWTGGAHPGAWSDLHAERLPSGGEVSFGDVFTGQDAAFMRASNAAAATMDEDERPCFGADASEWALVRGRGHWLARGRFVYLPEACRGMSLDFTVPITVPASVVGPDAFGGALPAGMLDGVQSPGGAIRVLVTPSGLATVAEEGSDVLERPGTQLVMAQWATGAAAVRWPQEAAAALAAPR